jgi:hypothetical protein
VSTSSGRKKMMQMQNILLYSVFASIGISFTDAQALQQQCDALFGLGSTCGGALVDSFYENNRVSIPINTSELGSNRFKSVPFVNGTITNFLLTAVSGTLECQNIVFGLALFDNSTHPVATVTQSSPNVCNVTWNDVFANTAALAAASADDSKEIMVGAESGIASTFEVDIFQSFGTEITFSSDDRPNFYVIDVDANPDSTNNDIVKLTLNTTWGKCRSDATEVILKFVPATEVSDGSCNVTMSLTPPNWSQNVTQEFIGRCSNSISNNGLNNNIYNMILNPYVSSGACVDEVGGIYGLTATGTQSATTSFSVIRSNDGSVQVTEEEFGSTGQVLISSVYEHAHATECNERIHAMDKVLVTHTVSSTWIGATAPSQLASTSNVMFGDYAMQSLAITCDSVSTSGVLYTRTCTIVYVSDECVPMTLDVDTDTCSFEYAFGGFTGASAWLEDVVNMLSLNVPIALKLAPLNECNGVTTIADLTSSTSATLTSFYTDTDNGIQLELNDVGADVSRTLAISDVTISMGGITRTFNVADKVRLMNISSSSYYSDVKYCRFLDYQTNGSAPTCDLPFFNKLKAGTMHASDFSMIDPSSTIVGDYASDSTPWLVPNKGYEDCSDIGTRNVDRWAFNPSKWVFRELRSQGVVNATVTVTAVLSTCAGPASSLRMLAGGVAPSTEVIQPTFNITIVFDPKSMRTDAPAPAEPALSAGEIAGIAIGAVVAFLILVCVVLIARGQQIKREQAKGVTVGN